MPNPKLLEPPPQWAIDLAIDAAKEATCVKSRRGVVIFKRDVGVFGRGSNGLPGGWPCASSGCDRDRCRGLAIHAEHRALMSASNMAHSDSKLELLHVKIDRHGGLAGSGGPSCRPCANAILDCGFVDAVWLYQHGRRVAPTWISYSAPAFYIESNANAKRIYHKCEKCGAWVDGTGQFDPSGSEHAQVERLPNGDLLLSGLQHVGCTGGCTGPFT